MDDDDYDLDPVAVNLRTWDDWVVYIASVLVILGLAWALGC